MASAASMVHMPTNSSHEDKSYNAPKLHVSLSDFEIVRRLGDGSFSTVVLAKYKGDGRLYAVKIVNKSLILRNKMADYIRNERNILDQLQHPGIAQLQFTFQDAESLYLGLEYCPNGELYEQLQERGSLPLADAVQYAAEVVDILAYLRSKEVMHRDLKPENLLLDGEGHLKLIDFGSAKALFLPASQRATGNRATSFVGTAEYVSPEVLNNTGISFAADLWALGCIIYQMLTGFPPFKGASEYLTFQLITSRSVVFNEDFPAAAEDLVDKLLQLDPDKRLGYGSIEEIKQHPFFAGVNWAAVREAPAPRIVACKRQSAEDMALDWELTSLIRSSTPVRYEYLPTGAAV